jgi:SnoaL-like domain
MCSAAVSHIRLALKCVYPEADQMKDVLAIQNLKARYFRLMDTKEWSEYRKLFADDMQFVATPTMPAMSSADEFVANVANLLSNATTVHQGHMPEITLTGNRTATGVWAMFDHVENASDGRSFEGSGHYHERYEKGDDGRWRIKELRLTRLHLRSIDAKL